MFTRNSSLKKIYKMLNLDKPLVFFDIETTGVGISSDKIVEIAYLRIDKDGTVKKNDIFLDPEIEIPAEATAVHNISNETVKNKPTFKEKSQELWEIFSDCYYGGFNVIDFDLPILRREFIRVGMDFEYNNKQIIDSKEIYRYMVPRTLSAAYEYYFWKRFKEKRNALVHAEVSAEMLLKQLERYKEIGNLEFINKIHDVNENYHPDDLRKFYWRNGEAHFAFSKYIDQPLSKVAEDDPEFLQWVLSASFSEETKNIVKLAIKEAESKKKEQEKLNLAQENAV